MLITVPIDLIHKIRHIQREDGGWVHVASTHHLPAQRVKHYAPQRNYEVASSAAVKGFSVRWESTLQLVVHVLGTDAHRSVLAAADPHTAQWGFEAFRGQSPWAEDGMFPEYWSWEDNAPTCVCEWLRIYMYACVVCRGRTTHLRVRGKKGTGEWLT